MSRITISAPQQPVKATKKKNKKKRGWYVRHCPSKSRLTHSITRDQQPGDALALQSRAQRFDVRCLASLHVHTSQLSSSASKPNKRARRRITAPKVRASEPQDSVLMIVQSDVGGDIDWNQLTIRGTSQSLEKLYLRLTSVTPTLRPLA